MARINTRNVAPRKGAGPVRTAQVPTGRTFEGAAGFERSPKGELFLMGSSYFAGDKSFYESTQERRDRFRTLTRQLATEDFAWSAGFWGWLRGPGNIRTASIIGALEAANAMVKAKIPGSRAIVSSVLQRSDEPGEAVAYWLQNFGHKMPMPIKKGIGDAVLRMWDEYALMKYDTDSHAVRFADVLALVHPGSREHGQHNKLRDGQRELFQYAIDRRYEENEENIEHLAMVKANRKLRQLAQEDPWKLTDTRLLREAGMTWEDTLSLVGSIVDKKKLWEALIPLMNLMAQIKNLRNFDQAGVSDQVAEVVIRKLNDPQQVARSRQFPFRFLSAYRHAPQLRWGAALEKALSFSVGNIPEMSGRTLILVDRSGSMFNAIAENTELTRADAAAVFGTALALRNMGRADLVQFGSTAQRVPVKAGDSLLRTVERGFGSMGGTDTQAATRAYYHNHDRVVIITDEQSHDGDPGDVVPIQVPIYTWNLDQGKYSSTATGPTRHLLGGLTDAGFKLIPLLEAGRDGSWPWERSE